MAELLKPPAVPTAILNFFASQPDFPAVAGDISEEFQHRGQSSGPVAAKRWYWRDAFRNAFALTWRELARTPVRTAVMAIACILAVDAVTALYVGVRWQFFLGRPEDLYFDHAYRYIVVLLNLLPSLAMGWVGGRLLRGREWALALMFTVISACLASFGSWYLLFWMKADLPPGFMFTYVITGNIARQCLFCLGCIWARQAKTVRSLPSQTNSETIC